MWQHFTERAKRVVFYAQEEAGKRGTNEVSTEHLLLGLLRENDHVAARMLDRMGVSHGRIRTEVEHKLTWGNSSVSLDKLLTPQAKHAIDLSHNEARLLENNYIGTEHLLLGLIREEEAIAGRVLAQLGVSLEAARCEIRKIQAEALEQKVEQFQTAQPSGQAPTVEVAPPALSPGRGHVGVLRSDNERQHVEFVSNADDLPAYIDVMDLKDEFAYRDLVAEGKVLLLSAGTGAKFLRAHSRDVYCVRILDGDHAGKIGYVLRQQLKDTKADDRPFPPEI
jgi:hypothetical protein